MEGGIIAAGLGSRFKEAGLDTPKPLLEVGGRPLLYWTLQQFKDAGITSIRIIFRKAICRQCTDFVEEAFPELELSFICKDTGSSSESFLTLLNSWDCSKRVLVTTVDSIYLPGMLKHFRQRAERCRKNSLFLGITSHVEDEKPLFVDLDSDFIITSMGRPHGTFVTTGAYLLEPGLAQGKDPKGYSALRILLKELAFSPGITAFGVDLGKVLDVDRPEDILSAERFIRAFT